MVRAKQKEGPGGLGKEEQWSKVFCSDWGPARQLIMRRQWEPGRCVSAQTRAWESYSSKVALSNKFFYGVQTMERFL